MLLFEETGVSVFHIAKGEKILLEAVILEITRRFKPWIILNTFFVF